MAAASIPEEEAGPIPEEAAGLEAPLLGLRGPEDAARAVRALLG